MNQQNIHKKLIRITTIPMALRYLLPGQMRFMRSNGFDVIMISADGKEINDIIENEGCRHIIVPMTRKITPFNDLQCLFQLISLFRKEKPDIVHTHTPKAGLLGMLAAWFCGVKIRIHTVAGLPMMVEKGFKYHLLKFTEIITYKAANHIWPNSNSILQFITTHHLAPAQKLSIIGKGSSNGIDLHRFNTLHLDATKFHAIKIRIDYADNKKYLLCIGRLVRDKGIIELINVFISLQQNDPLLQLLLVGDYENELDPLPASIIKEIENNRGIIHISWTNEVEYYMQIAHLFIFPSHREGFPNVVLQAGAMELPVICSRIPGNIDIVTHQVTGLIFENGNEKQLLEMILYALNNQLIVKTMAEQLKQNIQNDYQRENIWQNMLTAYKSLVN